MRKLFLLPAALLALSSTVAAQACNIYFSVAYTDGSDLKIGLTPDQNKFWASEGAKHFPGFCFNPAKPDFIVLWSELLSSAELSKIKVTYSRPAGNTGGTSAVSTVQSSKNSITDAGWTESSVLIFPIAESRAEANYLIYDLTKDPIQDVHQGSGRKSLEFENNWPSGGGRHSVASTIPDPADALKSALKWIKKDRKL